MVNQRKKAKTVRLANFFTDGSLALRPHYATIQAILARSMPLQNEHQPFLRLSAEGKQRDGAKREVDVRQKPLNLELAGLKRVLLFEQVDIRLIFIDIYSMYTGKSAAVMAKEK